MSDIAIRVENLSKLYHIGRAQQRHDTLRDALEAVFSFQSSVFSRRSHPGTDNCELKTDNSQLTTDDSLLWALKDVSFEVQRGEVVGIIGRNGAGKSTLLKILSRITEPTSGRVALHGRVASLLEVGTGFHPELTGRENIYLNGAILGMKRAEIDRKFDEIVAFAEIERFLDTPVKRYSSGMYVRLAFAVAAHLEPEILLVDEVLAVGDAAFQKKCLGKMGDVAREGRTVLFVSHNMAAILSLCNEAYLITQGRIACNGATESVVGQYMESATKPVTIPLDERDDRGGDGRVRLKSIIIDDGDGKSSIQCADRLRIMIRYVANEVLLNAVFLVGIYDQFNRPVFFLDSETAGGIPQPLPASGTVICTTDPVNLTPGPCIVNIAVLVGGVMADHVGGVYTFEIEADDFYGTGKLTSRQTALCLLKQDWQVQGDLDARNFV